MFLHLGRDVLVSARTIVSVIDMDTATSSRHTRAFLTKAEEEGRVMVVTDELPRSAVVCCEGDSYAVYICQISSRTLFKRSKNNDSFISFL